MRSPVRVSHRRAHRIRLSAPHIRTTALGAPLEFVRDDSGDGERSGWFKASNQAGWGMSQGGAQTVVGLYQRPSPPDIPGPQVSPAEGRGAAGLSLSVKLGQ